MADPGPMSRVAAIPPELLLRRDRTLRYERGGAVYATDGRVGYLRQIVVDEAAGEIVALVVEVEGRDHRIFLPQEAVDKTGGSAVFLKSTHRQFMEWAAHAPAYTPDRVAKVDLKALLRRPAPVRRDPRRAVAQAGRDYVETGPVATIDRFVQHVEAIPVPAALPALIAPADGTRAPAAPLVIEVSTGPR